MRSVTAWAVAAACVRGAIKRVNPSTASQAAARLFGMLLGGRVVPDARNVLRLMFHPDGLRPCVANWEAVARALVQRLHRGSDRRRPRRRRASS
ncbi:MAG: hypothetical protein ACRD1W_21910 [Vicinamibacterales bacterium]